MITKRSEWFWEPCDCHIDDVTKRLLLKVKNAPNHKLVACVELLRDNDTENNANARLIAAAPKTKHDRDALLAACEDESLGKILDYHCEDCILGINDCPQCVTGKFKIKLKAAIAAAKE